MSDDMLNNISEYFSHTFGVFTVGDFAITMLMAIFCIIALTCVFMLITDLLFNKMKELHIFIFSVLLGIICTFFLLSYNANLEISTEKYRLLSLYAKNYDDNPELRRVMTTASADNKITKAEYNQITEVANEAYKNKAKSVLEQYRNP